MERKHSVIKWDQRKDGYIIHDLGSTNGVRKIAYNWATIMMVCCTPIQTFLNDLPLSNGVALLRHGDVLRFGYGMLFLNSCHY